MGVQQMPAVEPIQDRLSKLHVLIVGETDKRVAEIGHALDKEFAGVTYQSVASQSAFKNQLLEDKQNLVIANLEFEPFPRHGILSIAYHSTPSIPVLFLSHGWGEKYGFAHLKAGAMGIVNRNRIKTHLAPMVRSVFQSHAQVSGPVDFETRLNKKMNLLEMVAKSTPLKKVFLAIVDYVESQHPGLLCSILNLPESQMSLTVGAAPSLPNEYNQAIEGLQIGPDMGSCGAAAYLRTPILTTYIQDSPLWTPYHQLAECNGLHSCWSLPILDSHHTALGTIAVYSRLPYVPIAPDLELLENARDIARLAIEFSRLLHHRLPSAQGVHRVVAAVRKLILCDELQDLYRKAVELAREELGIERCRLFIKVEDDIVGTFGTDGNRNTVDERDFSDAKNEFEEGFIRPHYSAHSNWTVKNSFHLEWNGSECIQIGHGWTAMTPIWGVNQNPIGLLCNDCAITGTPLQRTQQELLSVYCSHLGTLIEHKFAAIRLRPLEGLFEQLSGATQQVYWVANGDGSKVHYVSPAIDKLWGIRSEDLYADSRTWLNMVHPKDRKIATCPNAENDSLGKFDRTYRIQLANGTIRWIRDRRFPFVGITGAADRISGVAEDITERKTTELVERNDQMKAERSVRMKSLGMMAGGVAHELNNILGPLVGYPDLILEELTENDSIREDLHEMQSSTRRAAAVIQDLLLLARRDILQTQPTQINDVIKAYMVSNSFQKAKTGQPNVEVHVDFAPDARMVNASAAYMNRVVMNLIQHAFESIPDAGQIHISTLNQCVDETTGQYESIAEGEYVVLRVSDTGNAMSSEEIHHIFEPFYMKRKMSRGSSGLGLAIIYSILKGLNGFIDIYSEAGEGSQFDLYFPLSRDSVAEHIPINTDHHGTETILVVDDIPQQLNLAARMLAQLGYQVHMAKSGHAAVEFVRRHEIDLIVLDMIMDEGFDGLDTFRSIKEFCSSIRCIVASGFAETNRIRQALELGAGCYIKKPYSLHELGGAVRRELDRPSPV